MVGWVPVEWELSAKLKASVKSDVVLSAGKLALKASANMEAKLGGLYCAPGFFDSSDCKSVKQTGFTPINTLTFSFPNMTGEAESIVSDSGQLLSTTEFRYGVDVTLTLWGLLPITTALRHKLGFVVAKPSATGSMSPSAHPKLGYREYSSTTDHCLCVAGIVKRVVCG